jgi:LysR family hydrogen peroxide-inducible transcriptional activator
VRATSLTTLVQMVLGGLGVTLLPNLAAKAEDRKGQLALLPFVDPPPGRTIALVWRANSPLSKAYRTLGRAMAKTLKPQLESAA